MWSFFVVPFREFFNGLECEAMVVVCFKPFFDFAVALWVFYAAKYLLNAFGIKEIFKSRISVDNVCRELASVVANALFDLSVF